ncbi:glutathione S-transferase T1 isoform X2 [Lolium perenne]|uniref:glutathione S-transferase T1 isoform X2 n=1 Tax=Lolium perenne TaxID=4522 RepID=UPI003A9A4C8D
MAAMLKVYADRLSQPSRALIIFCRVNKLDFEEVTVNLGKGQHRTPEFNKINPMGQVPVIVDGRFRLFESHAILRYLATVFPGVPDHWYPVDLFTRAKIESILDWHHSNLRRGAESAEVSVANDHVRRGKEQALNGNPQPSIADLSLVCEIMQLEGGWWLFAAGG